MKVKCMRKENGNIVLEMPEDVAIVVTRILGAGTDYEDYDRYNSGRRYDVKVPEFSLLKVNACAYAVFASLNNVVDFDYLSDETEVMEREFVVGDTYGIGKKYKVVIGMEEATGDTLFFVQTLDGLPVEVVYDEKYALSWLEEE
jgi:hypothetical protein